MLSELSYGNGSINKTTSRKIHQALRKLDLSKMHGNMLLFLSKQWQTWRENKKISITKLPKAEPQLQTFPTNVWDGHQPHVSTSPAWRGPKAVTETTPPPVNNFFFILITCYFYLLTRSSAKLGVFKHSFFLSIKRYTTRVLTYKSPIHCTITINNIWRLISQTLSTQPM